MKCNPDIPGGALIKALFLGIGKVLHGEIGKLTYAPKVNLPYKNFIKENPGFPSSFDINIGWKLLILTNFLNLAIQLEGEFFMAKRFWVMFKFDLVPQNGQFLEILNFL